MSALTSSMACCWSGDRVRANILLHRPHIDRRHVELVVSQILDGEELSFLVLEPADALVSPYSVMDMDDIIANLKIGQ